jgi:hypothetical protein
MKRFLFVAIGGLTMAFAGGSQAQPVNQPEARVLPPTVKALRVSPPVADTAQLWREAGAAQRAYALALKRAVDAEYSTQAARGAIDAELAEAKRELDSLSELTELDSLRLQMAMDRMSKAQALISNMLKKSSDTANSIIQNMK